MVKLAAAWPVVLVAAASFPAAAYILGLYTPVDPGERRYRRLVLVAGCLAIVFAAGVGFQYLFGQAQVGRGVLGWGLALGGAAVMHHHARLLSRSRFGQDRVAFVAASAHDRAECDLIWRLPGQQMFLVGIVQVDVASNDALANRPDVTLAEAGSLLSAGRVDRIFCGRDAGRDPRVHRFLREASYNGVPVNPLVSLFEESYQWVPLDFVSSEWLMAASRTPHRVYLLKLKRLFDLLAAITLLLLAAPLLLLGMLAVRLTSPGPVFYRQERLGRFGRRFTVWKLRTMRVDAERDGPVWAAAGDSRVTPVGALLRKYRIDEIPQLLCVISGTMSLVGPRPERAEFAAELEAKIPHFRERLHVQPGLTGWAQVKYPYGASVEDSQRKLEYDLYYMKHMSVLLDLFILLDTVRTVIRGGVHYREPVPPALLERLRSAGASWPGGELARPSALPAG